MPVNNFYSLFTALNQHFICTLIRVFQKALFLHISHNFIQNLRKFSSFYTILCINCQISIHRFRIKYKRVPLFLHNNTLLHNYIYDIIYDIGSGKVENRKLSSLPIRQLSTFYLFFSCSRSVNRYHIFDLRLFFSNLNLTITAHAGTGRNQLTDNNVFFETQ